MSDTEFFTTSPIFDSNPIVDGDEVVQDGGYRNGDPVMEIKKSYHKNNYITLPKIRQNFVHDVHDGKQVIEFEDDFLPILVRDLTRLARQKGIDLKGY